MSEPEVHDSVEVGEDGEMGTAQIELVDRQREPGD